MALPAPGVEQIDGDRSSPTRLVWQRGDGSFVAEMSTSPKWFQDPKGAWQEIDPSVRPMDGRRGWVETSAAAWSVRFGPITPAGGGIEIVAEDGGRVSWRPSERPRVVEPVVSDDGVTVTYPEMWSGVDLVYRLSTVGVREEMVVSSPAALRDFDFDVDQAMVRDEAAERAVAAVEGMPEARRRVHRFQFVEADSLLLGAPVVFSAGGEELLEAPVVSRVASQPGGASRWTVGVERGWAERLPESAFPLVVDPDIAFGPSEATPTRWLGMKVWGSNFYLCGHNYPPVGDFCWPRVGNSTSPTTSSLNRTIAEYDTKALLGPEDGVTKTLVAAGVLFHRLGGDTTTRALRVYTPTTWDWPGAIATLRTQVNFGTADALANVFSWVNMSGLTRFGYRGVETTGVYSHKDFSATLFVSWSENYTPTVAQPEVPLVVTSTSPSVKVTATDPDTDTLTYTFQVSRSPGFESGTIAATVNHGPTSARTVTKSMPGLLDGTTYWVRARAVDQAGHVSAWSPRAPFHVNQRLGAGQAAPTDSFGPVTVNLATGNVATSIATPQYPVVGGSLGATFTYNSKDTRPEGVLPQRWTMSGVVPEAEFTSARINTGAAGQGGSVTLTAPDGGKFEFHRQVAGNTEFYTPIVPTGAVLTVGDDDVVQVSTAGLQYEFAPGVANEDVPLLQVRQVADILSPATPTGSWSGDRLQSVSDPVSGQVMTVSYGGGTCPSPPSGFIAAPTGMVCQVSLPGEQETNLFYTGTSGQPRLSRVENPGEAITDFEYGTGLDLLAVRTASAADVLAASSSVAGLAWADDDDAVGPLTQWHLSYDGGELERIWSPVPDEAELRLWKDYDFDVAGGETTVTRSGAPSQYTTVTFDEAGRPLSTVTPTPSGTRVVTNTWDTFNEDTGEHRELLAGTSDSATGLRSTTKHDDHDWPVASYGPAPIAAFASGDFPTSGVPTSTVNYDEGLTGLVVHGWDNPDLAGAPSHASLNFENSSGLSFTDWGSGAPSGLPGNGWSVRMTGDLSFPEDGDWRFQVWSNVGYRVWVDNQMVLDQWEDPDDPAATGWSPVTNPAGAGAYAKSEGFYNSTDGATVPVRVELKDTHGRASFALRRRIGSWSHVDASSLSPRLGFMTSTTDADGHVTRTSYTGGSVSAVYGVPSAATVETAPADLVESYEYETSFLRRTARTLPGGPDTKVRYEHTDGTADSPCDAATDVPQAGRQTRSISATSGTAGDAVTYATFYDDRGRVQGSTSGRFADVDAGTTAWTCSTFDDRGRVVQVDHPAFGGTAARTVTHDHAVGGNPLVGSVSDPAGTITTRVDLLGRVVSSTDVWGVLTTTGYDAAGRAATSTVVAGATSFTRGTEYDALGRPVTHKLNGNVLAAASFDAAGRLTAVSFPSGSGNAGNATSGTFSYSASTGHLDANHWTQSSAALLTSDEVTQRWETGRIRNQAVDGVDPNGGADNYVYDGAWRLTAATVASSAGSTTYGYGFAATGGCGDLTSAGANSNRTSKTVTPAGGSAVVSAYCYDNADRLTSTTDPTVGALGYDDHGNTTTLGGETHVYDHANRHLATSAPASGGGTTTVEYLRDATDRVVQRKVNGAIEGRYAHSAAGDTPTLALDGSNNVTGASLALPGGVLYKWLPATPGASLWEYPNLQGSLVATAGQTGTKIGDTRSYDPDGNQVTGATPDTGPGDFDYGWLGAHQRPLEHHDDLQPVIQMGARQYHPRLARFLAVDPIEAGVHNDYGYVTDPINETDLTGEFWNPCGLPAWVTVFSSKCDKRTGPGFRSPHEESLRKVTRASIDAVGPRGISAWGLLFGQKHLLGDYDSKLSRRIIK